MNKKLKIECVLLVDDNESTNFLNRKIINSTDSVENIFETYNGFEALDFIKHQGKYKEVQLPKPNIIFLDINMPKMGGFEFLEEYNKLSEEKKAEIVVVFLTTSNWSKDKVKAMNNELVYDFMEKPLSCEKFEKIYDYYMQNFVKSESI